MKIVPIGFEIDGLGGSLELREPSVSAIRPFMHLMSEDTQSFLLEVLNVSLYMSGQPVPDALDKIGMSELSRLIPLVTELLGFEDETEKKD